MTIKSTDQNASKTLQKVHTASDIKLQGVHGQMQSEYY